MSTPTPATHERQPLLTAEAQNNGQAYTSPDVADGELGQAEAVLQPKKTRSKVKIAWYIFLVLLCAFGLAVFIKGWIDADDVDVRFVKNDSRS